MSAAVEGLELTGGCTGRPDVRVHVRPVQSGAPGYEGEYTERKPELGANLQPPLSSCLPLPVQESGRE